MWIFGIGLFIASILLGILMPFQAITEYCCLHVEWVGELIDKLGLYSYLLLLLSPFGIIISLFMLKISSPNIFKIMRWIGIVVIIMILWWCLRILLYIGSFQSLIIYLGAIALTFFIATNITRTPQEYAKEIINKTIENSNYAENQQTFIDNLKTNLIYKRICDLPIKKEKEIVEMVAEEICNGNYAKQSPTKWEWRTDYLDEKPYRITLVMYYDDNSIDLYSIHGNKIYNFPNGLPPAKN